MLPLAARCRAVEGGGARPDHMQVSAVDIPEVRLLSPRRFEDARGFFSETWSRRRLREQGIDLDFVQDNHSLSREVGTVRGLHYQIHPFAQSKLVRVTRGAILDVAVDLRRGSPTFGRHVSAIISAEEWNQFLVPVGFAHGFCTLEPDTEVIYKVDNDYAPECDRGLRWNDPALGIAWPVEEARATLSAKDRQHPLLHELKDLF